MVHFPVHLRETSVATFNWGFASMEVPKIDGQFMSWIPIGLGKKTHMEETHVRDAGFKYPRVLTKAAS